MLLLAMLIIFKEGNKTKLYLDYNSEIAITDF